MTAVLFKEIPKCIYGSSIVNACNVLLSAPSRRVIMIKAGLLLFLCTKCPPNVHLQQHNPAISKDKEQSNQPYTNECWGKHFTHSVCMRERVRACVCPYRYICINIPDQIRHVHLITVYQKQQQEKEGVLLWSDWLSLLTDWLHSESSNAPVYHRQSPLTPTLPLPFPCIREEGYPNIPFSPSASWAPLCSNCSCCQQQNAQPWSEVAFTQEFRISTLNFILLKTMHV